MTYHQIRPELGALAVDITTISPNPDNPNNGDVDAVAESMTVNGQYAPIVVDLDSRIILAGHTRYAAALTLGWTHIAAVLVGTATEAEAVRIMLADNRTGQMAVMDSGILLSVLQRQESLAGTGYGADDVARLSRALSVPLVFPEKPVPAGPSCPLCGR